MQNTSKVLSFEHFVPFGPPISVFRRQNGGGGGRVPPFAPGWWLTFVENQCPTPIFFFFLGGGE